MIAGAPLCCISTTSIHSSKPQAASITRLRYFVRPSYPFHTRVQLLQSSHRSRHSDVHPVCSRVCERAGRIFMGVQMCSSRSAEPPFHSGNNAGAQTRLSLPPSAWRNTNLGNGTFFFCATLTVTTRGGGGWKWLN